MTAGDDQKIPFSLSRHVPPADHDLRSLETVEKHLLARLEFEFHKQDKTRSVPARPRVSHPMAPGGERRINRLMSLHEVFPDGKLALRGRLSPFSATLDRDTVRAYLSYYGRIVTVLYVNYNAGTCLTSSLVV